MLLVEPHLAKPFHRDGWLYEEKYDRSVLPTSRSADFSSSSTAFSYAVLDRVPLRRNV
jgi:hypothetical protein